MRNTKERKVSVPSFCTHLLSICIIADLLCELPANRQRLQAERDWMAQEFQEVTRMWVEESTGSSHATRRVQLAKRMRAQYFDLDPYIRGRGAYHRLGNIVGK